MSTDWCMEEQCRHRHWRSGSMPTHRRGDDCPPESGPVTGMEHAIEQAAQVLDAVDRNHDLDSGDLASSEEYARALAEAGLLAPAPLREVRERGTLSGGVLHFFGSSPSEYVKYRTDWLPVDRAEGDGSADQ